MREDPCRKCLFQRGRHCRCRFRLLRKADLYLGPIKTKRDATRVARALAFVPGDRARDARRLLERNWHSVAARPELARRMVELITLDAMSFSNVNPNPPQEILDAINRELL